MFLNVMRTVSAGRSGGVMLLAGLVRRGAAVDGRLRRQGVVERRTDETEVNGQLVAVFLVHVVEYTASGHLDLSQLCRM